MYEYLGRDCHLFRKSQGSWVIYLRLLTLCQIEIRFVSMNDKIAKNVIPTMTQNDTIYMAHILSFPWSCFAQPTLEAKNVWSLGYSNSFSMKVSESIF